MPHSRYSALKMLYDDWVTLNTGDAVVVERRGDIPREGTVDVVSEDASVFWVWLAAGQGRILVSADDSLVWRLP